MCLGRLDFLCGGAFGRFDKPKGNVKRENYSSFDKKSEENQSEKLCESQVSVKETL